MAIKPDLYFINLAITYLQENDKKEEKKQREDKKRKFDEKKSGPPEKMTGKFHINFK